MHPDELSLADIAALARLQVDSLPESLVSRLGLRYAAGFYHFVRKSPQEALFVRREGGEIVAGCVLSLAPASLSRRLLAGTPLLWAALVGLGRAPVRASLWRMAVDMLRPSAIDPSLAALLQQPEVVMLFATADRRGHGHGTALLSEAERLLKERSTPRYVVRTGARDGDPVLAFYRRHGFVLRGQFDAHGSIFRLLEKTLG